MQRDFWSRHYRVSLSFNWGTNWRRGGLCFHENGGRAANECLDLNWVLGRQIISLTIWRIGSLSGVLRWLPRGRGGRGLLVGFTPLGAAPQ